MKQIPIIALLCGLVACRADSGSPLGGYFITQSNGGYNVPIVGIYRQGHGDYPLTNWMSVTSCSTPRVVTSILKPAKADVAKPGQLWVASTGVYENTPEVQFHPGETNETFSFPSYKTTNYWPNISDSTALIYVSWIERADAGRVAGLEYYAHCRVRLWSHTSAFVERDSTMLLSSLTNNATLLKP